MVASSEDRIRGPPDPVEGFVRDSVTPNLIQMKGLLHSSGASLQAVLYPDVENVVAPDYDLSVVGLL